MFYTLNEIRERIAPRHGEHINRFETAPFVNKSRSRRRAECFAVTFGSTKWTVFFCNVQYNLRKALSMIGIGGIV